MSHLGGTAIHARRRHCSLRICALALGRSEEELAETRRELCAVVRQRPLRRFRWSSEDTMEGERLK